MWGEGQSALADVAAAMSGGAIGVVLMLALIAIAALLDGRNNRSTP